MIGVKGRRPYKSCEPQVMTGPQIVKAPSIGEEVIFNVKARLSCEEPRFVWESHVSWEFHSIRNEKFDLYIYKMNPSYM